MTKKRVRIMCGVAAAMLSALAAGFLSGCTREEVTVTFRAAGEEDIVLTTSYGGSITPPEVPEKKGNEGRWETEEFDGITQDMTVNAIYETQGLEYTFYVSGGRSYYAASKGKMAEDIEELYIPATYRNVPVEQIEPYGFKESESLRSAVLPEGFTEIGEQAFYKCRKLEEVIIPYGVTTIGEFSFAFCALKAIELPESVTTLKGYAFSSCSELKIVEIPNSVVNIENSVFDRCKELESIKLPDGLTANQITCFGGVNP